VEDLDSYHRGRNTVLIAGALPQGLGILFTILWESKVKPASETAFNMMIATVPLFGAGLLAAFVCMLVIVLRKEPMMKVRGALHGMTLYFGLWTVTTLASCGWSISRVGRYFDLLP